jgi:DNA-binding transcriptional MerR regulator
VSNALPPIPPKRYFTIGEVSELCDVKPYVLRYWEQEFTQLRPMKRRGNRRYYQHHEVLLVRRIRELLYEKRFTISGARDRLAESQWRAGSRAAPSDEFTDHLLGGEPMEETVLGGAGTASLAATGAALGAAGASFAAGASGMTPVTGTGPLPPDFDLRRELMAIRRLLSD